MNQKNIEDKSNQQFPPRNAQRRKRRRDVATNHNKQQDDRNDNSNENNSLDDRYDEASLHNGENDNYDTASRTDHGQHDHDGNLNRSSNNVREDQGAQDDRLGSGKDATIAGGAAGAGATGNAAQHSNKKQVLVLDLKLMKVIIMI